MRFSSLFLVSTAAALTACGGGGSSGSASGTSTTPASSGNYTMYNAVDSRIRTTVTHGVNDESDVKSIASAVESTVTASTGPSSLTAFTLDNGVDSMAINTSSTSTAGLYTQTAGNRTAYVGGTTWSHSRYGFLVAKTPNSNGANTAYIVRNMPFVYVNQYNTPTLSNATYNKGNAKAVGTYVINGIEQATVTCNISIAFSVVGAAETADISLSGCQNSNSVAITTTGFVRATKPSNANGFATSTNGTTPFTSVSGVNTFTVSNVSIYYRLGGPSGEEMVGTLFIDGNSSFGGVTKPTQVSLAFGAKK